MRSVSLTQNNSEFKRIIEKLRKLKENKRYIYSRMRMRGFSSLLIALCPGGAHGRVHRPCLSQARLRSAPRSWRWARWPRWPRWPFGPFRASFIAPRHRCLASGEVQWLRAEVPSFDVLRAPPPSFGVGGVWGVILCRGY